MPEIRPMENSHTAPLAELEKLCFSSPWSRVALEEEVGRPGSIFYVAEEDGEVLGYAGMQVVLDEAYITNICTHPEHRRRGIASALTGALLRYGEANGLAFITLEVRPSNAGAVRLYEGLGFVREAVRKNFYRNPTEDGLLMFYRYK